MSENSEYKKLITLYARCFSVPAGEAVIEHLTKTICGSLSFVQGDPHMTAFNEGRRSVVMEILNRVALGSDPERLKRATQANYSTEE